jgi:hypothetical protein
MIVYTLRCHEGHGFESWFQSSGAYEALAKAGHLSCPNCGDNRIAKAPMAPAVALGERSGAEASPSAARTGEAPAAPVSLARPTSELERAIAALRKEVEARSDYVGPRFVQEARAMHLGEAPERAIHGEARPDEARQLVEEGVPILPLPFLPGRKTN